MVIAFSVQVVGVVLVFSFLVVPAAIAFQFAERWGPLTALAWLAGTVASAVGLALSFRYDLPTGPAIVCVFGLLLALTFLVKRLRGTAA